VSKGEDTENPEEIENLDQEVDQIMEKRSNHSEKKDGDKVSDD
jgi:hypothetical protein